MQAFDVGVLANATKEVFRGSTTPGQAEKIERLMNRFLNLNGDRVRVAHGLWVPGMEGGTVHHVPRGKFQPRHHVDQAVELEKLADQAAQLRGEMEAAFNMGLTPGG